MSTEKEATKKVSLKDLDDISCSNVVIARQIKKICRKFPFMRSTDIDCWVHNHHFTKFKINENEMLTWLYKVDPALNDYESVSLDDQSLYNEELHKLLVFTHEAMCDNKDNVDLIDTPEDLLSFAESKLKEMLMDEASESA